MVYWLVNITLLSGVWILPLFWGFFLLRKNRVPIGMVILWMFCILATSYIGVLECYIYLTYLKANK